MRRGRGLRPTTPPNFGKRQVRRYAICLDNRLIGPPENFLHGLVIGVGGEQNGFSAEDKAKFDVALSALETELIKSKKIISNIFFSKNTIFQDRDLSYLYLQASFEKIDESIALSAMYAANHLEGVKAIVSMTETGATPLLMSRIRSKLPIFSFSGQLHTQRRMALYRGVQTIPFNAADVENEEVNRFAIDTLLEKKIVEEGDFVILTKGDYVSAQGGTNTMKILRVGGDIR